MYTLVTAIHIGYNYSNNKLTYRQDGGKRKEVKERLFYGAIPTKNNKYTVKRFTLVGEHFTLTDCREFNTWEEADKAAQFMANQDEIEYVNMR